MRRLLYTLLSVIVTCSLALDANARKEEDPCKYVKETKDAFTGEVAKKAVVSTGAMFSYGWEITLGKAGDKY